MLLKNSLPNHTVEVASKKTLPIFVDHKYENQDQKCNSPGVSNCRVCNYYNIVGRSGGLCEMYNCEVKGEWRGCPLGVPMFSPDTT